ncbi:MAG TPA: restriction endonuclease subunit S, partial [candidate division Zixibacteria bacterium]|nr:restriction endonuclease subunit S [candidate division Zixibacteria bacterium]
EWFVKFRFPGFENTKFIDSPLGKIPEGWEGKLIKDFGEVITGKTPSKKDPSNFGNDVPFIKTPDMHSGIFVTDIGESLSVKGADSQKKKYLPPGSIMVSCIGSAGVVSINSAEAQTNQQINSVKLDDEKHREYLYFALIDLEETIKNYGSTGATMTNLSKGKFEALNAISPSKHIDEFHETTSPMFDEILCLSRKNDTLKVQRDLLMPKLISGSIRL